MDQTWRIPGKRIDEPQLKKAGLHIAEGYAGVSVEVVREDPEFITFFFEVPKGANDDAQTIEIELTIYQMGRDGLVLSLEADAADNNAAWEDACQLTEDLAEHLQGTQIDI